MVAMSLLDGKGTLWGPVLVPYCSMWSKKPRGHIFGLQWVVLGLILIVNIVYFQQGIMGWLQAKYPERFGIAVDGSTLASKEGVMVKMLLKSKSFKILGGVKANVDITMSVKKGSITDIIGPNGCGKSTLFNSIVGYHPIDNGSIKFEGGNIPPSCG